MLFKTEIGLFNRSEHRRRKRLILIYNTVCGSAGISQETLIHEEPQEVIFLHGIWRHIEEFGIEGQIPRISSPVKLEKRC